MAWLQRWNFIERARLERELWDAFERGADLDAVLAECRARVERQRAEGGDDDSFRLEIWEATRQRIRRIEALMRDQPGPGSGGPGSGAS